MSQDREFELRRTAAGPFVSGVTLSGPVVVASGQNTTVDPFLQDGSLSELRWCKSLDDALMELLGEVVESAGWSTDLPETG